MITDSIGDCFSRLRNGAKARRETVNIPFSKLNERILALLKQEGFITEIGTEDVGKSKRKYLVAHLKFHSGNTAVLEHIVRRSKPGQRIYSKVPNGKGVRQGLGFQILSTPKGLMTDRQAIEAKVGGEVIGEVW